MQEIEISSPVTPSGAAPSSVTLEAIASLLDKQFDKRLGPLTDAMEEFKLDVVELKGGLSDLKDEVEADRDNTNMSAEGGNAEGGNWWTR